MLMSVTPGERVKMACSMFHAARALVLSSLRAEDPTATPVQLRQRLFLRFYGHEFSPDETRRILAHIERQFAG